MKRIFSLMSIVLVVTLGLVIGACANETNPVTVTLNGQVVDCASYGQNATIVEDRTLVPLRAIFEALGADIIWDDASRTVISVRGNDLVELTIGSNVLLKNKQNVEVDVPARIMNDRTMVPVRVIAESFGVKVDWNNDTRTVILECAPETFPKTLEVKGELSAKHVYGEFDYGMTMQKVWDAISADEGEKSVHAFGDGRAEIQISDNEGKYKNEDSEITGETNCNLVRLLFADDYLYGVYVFSDYLELDKAVSVRDAIVNHYGKPDTMKSTGSDSEYDSEYQWVFGQQEVLCRILEVYEGDSKLGDVCKLSITDRFVEKLLSGEVPEPSEKNEEKEDTKTDDEKDEDDEPVIEPEEPEEDEEDEEELGSVEDARDLAVEALEKYLDACNSFDFSRLAELTVNSYGMDKLGVEGLDDALDYAGVTKQSLASTMIEKTYSGNVAYVPLADAVIEVVLDFVSDASNLLYYTIDGVKSDNGGKIVFEVTHYTPDISLMEKIFADSFDKAVKKAFDDGTVSFSMTQDEMMPLLADLAADELAAAFDNLLDTDTFVASSKESISVVEKGFGKWLVELDENESEIIKTIKKGGSEILELFGFDVN